MLNWEQSQKLRNEQENIHNPPSCVSPSSSSSHKLSSGSAASPISPSAAPPTNLTPRLLRPSPGSISLEMAATWLRLLRRQWTTWAPCVLALPATCAPVRATRTWARCHGYCGGRRATKVKWRKLWCWNVTITLVLFIIDVPIVSRRPRQQ